MAASESALWPPEPELRLAIEKISHNTSARTDSDNLVFAHKQLYILHSRKQAMKHGVFLSASVLRNHSYRSDFVHQLYMRNLNWRSKKPCHLSMYTAG